MSVTDDLRAARKNRQFHSARDFEASSSQIGDVEPFGEDLKRRAQLVIAASAVGPDHHARVADAVLLMRMLGVHPDDVFDPSLASLAPAPHPTATR